MRNQATVLFIGLLLMAVAAVVLSKGMFAMNEVRSADERTKPEGEPSTEADAKLDRATFGAGCFWCTEAVFQQLRGVRSVVSGYSGGHVPNPTYQQVCGGTTGHAEAVQISYDPQVISYAELLEVFWQSHDPTTLNRQGNDAGTQYRSAIFYHDDEQRKLAEHYQQMLDASGAFDTPIVTEIVPFREFYRAEAYHQNYFEQNPSQPYCAFVVRPKLEKFKKVFRDKLKTSPEH